MSEKTLRAIPLKGRQGIWTLGAEEVEAIEGLFV